MLAFVSTLFDCLNFYILFQLRFCFIFPIFWKLFLYEKFVLAYWQIYWHCFNKSRFTSSCFCKFLYWITVWCNLWIYASSGFYSCFLILVFSRLNMLGNNLHLCYLCRYREYTVMTIKHMRWRREKTKENVTIVELSTA